MFWRKGSHSQLGNPFNDFPSRMLSSYGKDPVLTNGQRDNVYYIQCREPQPWLLIRTIFYNAEVLNSNGQSEKVFEQLVNMELLSPAGEVNTEPVERKDFGKNILSRLAFIPQFKTKLVIDLLFWWAEETQRLKKLVAEKNELLDALQANSSAVNEYGVPVKKVLEHCQAKILREPSARTHEEEYNILLPPRETAYDQEQPPPYQR